MDGVAEVVDFGDVPRFLWGGGEDDAVEEGAGELAEELFAFFGSGDGLAASRTIVAPLVVCAPSARGAELKLRGWQARPPATRNHVRLRGWQGIPPAPPEPVFDD